MTRSPSGWRRWKRADRQKFADRVPKELGRRSIRGGAVAIGSQAARLIVRVGAMMALARLVSPEDFGVQGMVVAITNFMSAFRDLGLTAVTVQRDALTDEEVSTLFWINAALGFLLAGSLVVAAPGIAWFYGDPRLTDVAIASAMAFVVGGFSVQHMALLQRKMRFMAIAVIETVALVGSATVGVIMAWHGLGYWALVAMAVAQPCIITLGAWSSLPWLPGLPQRGNRLRGMLGFGSSVTSAGLIMSGAVNIDKVLVGDHLGATSLGFYGRAYQLVNLPSEAILYAIGTVAMPALSRLQVDPTSLHRAFLRIYSVTLAMTVPVTVMCGVFAEDLVRAVFGPKWSEATLIVQLLAPTILASGLITPLGWFALSSGQYRKSLAMTAFLAPVMVLGVTLGLRAGTTGVAMGLSIAMVAATIPLILWMRAGTAMSTYDLLRAIRAPILSGLVAAVAGYVARMFMGGDPAAIERLALGVLVLFSTYLLMLLVVFRQANVYLGLIRQLRGNVGGSVRTS